VTKGTGDDTVDFTNGFVLTQTGSTITVDGSGFVHRTGSINESVDGNKTFTGDTTLANTTVSNGKTVAVGDSSNTTSTGTLVGVNTGNGLTSGQAFNVNTGTSTFTTGNTQDVGNATRGFFYGGATGSYAGAVTISNSGAFTGTLVALTADSTTTGTVLGISAKNLTSGKAIDVALGTLYSGTTDSLGTIGAVNIRAQSFTGNILNVSAIGVGAAASNLVNFQSNQLAGNVLRLDGQQLTSGNAVSVLLGTAGNGYLLNTTGGYTGSLIDLQVNSVSKFKVDEAGNTTVGGTLGVAGDVTVNTNKLIINATTGAITGPNAGAFSIDNGNASAINIGGTTATTVNIGRSDQIQALLGNATVAGTLGVGGDFAVNTSKFAVTAASGNTVVAGTLGVAGDVTVNTNRLTINATTGAIAGPNSGAFTIDNGNASAINLGTATATTINIGRTGQSTVVGGVLTSTETFVVGPGTPNKLVVSSTTGNLTSQGIGQFGSTSANYVSLSGAASGGNPVVLQAFGASDANVGMNLTPKGSGRVSVTGNGGGLDVAGDIIVGSSNKIQLVGATSPSNPALQIASSSTDANVSLQIIPKGSGRVQVQSGLDVAGTLIGPTSGTWTIDAGNANVINIGGTTATTVNIGHTGQTQALLGNGTVAGTFAVTGVTTLSGTLNIGTGSSAPVHIVSAQTTAPTVAVGNGAGTTGSCTLTNGTDVAGLITITVGGTKTASAAMCTITFNSAYGNAPTVALQPHDSATALLTNTNTMPFVTSSTGTFVITANTTTAGNGTYSWFYVVIGR